jgi:hypothetical protein
MADSRSRMGVPPVACPERGARGARVEWARSFLWIARLAALAFLYMGALAAAEYQSASPEPTPEETLMVELLNRFRADPKAEAERIAPPGKEGGRGGVDWEMFRKETSALPSVPPVVINLDLLDATRRHSHYQILNGMTHEQDAGKPGFTGKSFGERDKKSGYKGSPRSENCFRDASDPWGAHSGFIVDAGPGGAGGMQPERGHRRNMSDGSVKEVGLSGLPHDGHLCVTHNFGVRGSRFAGGVVYVDRDANQFYSIGEGVGGVTITASDGSAVQTWTNGGYTLELRGSKNVTLKASFMGLSCSKDFEAGKDNVKFDWVIKPEVLGEHADKLIAKVEQAPAENEAARKKAIIELCLGTQGLPLDRDRKAKIAQLSGPVGEELRTSQEAVLAALKTFDAREFTRILGEKRKSFGGTAAASWFSEADLIGKVKAQVVALEANAQRQKIAPSVRQPFIKSLEGLGQQIREPVFLAELSALKSRAETAGQ